MMPRLFGAVSIVLAALLLSACEGPSSVETTDPPREPFTGPPREAVRIDVYPEVWSSNGYDGQTYEFKVNCGSNYSELEECFLWDLARVAVVAPDNTQYDLEKDFNVSAYSGEVTRRWVLYGPLGGDLPAPGTYRFVYYSGEGEVAMEQEVSYAPEVVGYPENVVWSREDDDLVVEWTPPQDARNGMWYKVLIFPDDGEVISQVFEWDADSARLPDVPLDEGDLATVNVAIYFSDGYAYSEYVPLEW